MFGSASPIRAPRMPEPSGIEMRTPADSDQDCRNCSHPVDDRPGHNWRLGPVEVRSAGLEHRPALHGLDGAVKYRCANSKPLPVIVHDVARGRLNLRCAYLRVREPTYSSALPSASGRFTGAQRYMLPRDSSRKLSADVSAGFRLRGCCPPIVPIDDVIRYRLSSPMDEILPPRVEYDNSS